MGTHLNVTLWPNSVILSIDLRPLRLRSLRLGASLLAHLRCSANTNAANPWYECSAMVWCHWLLVVDAPQCAEDAMSEHQLTLLQSSYWPRVGLYGAQKWH